MCELLNKVKEYLDIEHKIEICKHMETDPFKLKLDTLEDKKTIIKRKLYSIMEKLETNK